MEATLTKRKSLGESEVSAMNHVQCVLLRLGGHLVHFIEFHFIVLKKRMRERDTSASICSKYRLINCSRR